MSEIIAQAFRVGFKAGAEHIVEILERSQAEMAEQQLFDQTTLEAVMILTQALRRVIDESGELS